jgi:hypothetical protein
VYKIFKLFSHTTTLKVGSYRFANKNTFIKVLKNNTNGALVGATESHAVPIRLNDKKVSMYNNNSKEIEPLTKQEFDELMKIVS